MTLIRKRTMKLVAVVLIAALVLLMLPMTAKATEYKPTGNDPYFLAVTADGVFTDPDDPNYDASKQIFVFQNFGTDKSVTADSITVHGTTVTIKNMIALGQEMYLGIYAKGYTLAFEGTNKLSMINAYATPGTVTIDLVDSDSSLTLMNDLGYGYGVLIDAAEYYTIVAADGVTATPADFMDKALAARDSGKGDGTVVFSKGGSSEDTPTSDYVINDGSTDPITAQTGKDLVIKCSGPLEHLSNVLMDGNEVAAENMSLENGSTILTLKAAYLATLAAGEHTVSFVYDDGTTVDATFTLTKTPQTGDPMATYVLVVAIAAGVATTVVFAKKKSANE